MRGGKIKYNVDENVVLEFYNSGKSMTQIAKTIGVLLGVIQRVVRNNKDKFSPINNATGRFWRNVEKSGEDDCWNWIGTVNNSGYGSISYQNKASLAHRFAYYLSNGEIPTGMIVCHKCDNPKCCNPKHLFLGTQADNMQDCKRKGRLKPPNKPAIHPSYSHYRKGCRCEACVNEHKKRYNKYKKVTDEDLLTANNKRFKDHYSKKVSIG